MNRYVTKLDISMPLVETRIRNIFLDINKFTKPYKFTKARTLNWKTAKTNTTADSNFDWLKEINQAVIDYYGENNLIFQQYKIEEPYKKQILDLLPKSISSIVSELAVQWAKGGDYIQPHKDYERKCGLFYSINKADCETRWYKQKNEIQQYHKNISYAIPSDLEIDHVEIIQPGKWYLFNHGEYHSVHKLPDAIVNRKSFVIEFRNDTYEEILQKILV